MRILAVDDDPFILELIPMILAKMGYHDVTTVPSGDMAISAIARTSRPFDCLLLDIDMYGMDGIALCARVRKLPAYTSTPIIMLTAMSSEDFLDRAFDAGATGYSTKPFDLPELEYQLRRAKALISVDSH